MLFFESALSGACVSVFAACLLRVCCVRAQSITAHAGRSKPSMAHCIVCAALRSRVHSTASPHAHLNHPLYPAQPTANTPLKSFFFSWHHFLCCCELFFGLATRRGAHATRTHLIKDHPYHCRPANSLGEHLHLLEHAHFWHGDKTTTTHKQGGSHHHQQTRKTQPPPHRAKRIEGTSA